MQSEKERVIDAFKADAMRRTGGANSDVTLSQFMHRLDSLMEQAPRSSGSMCVCERERVSERASE